MSQGYIGYDLQKAIRAELSEESINSSAPFSHRLLIHMTKHFPNHQ